MPAEYGSRISSVIDVQMKDGNMNHWTVEGGIGLIASRLTVQGPILKNKCSVIFSVGEPMHLTLPSLLSTKQSSKEPIISFTILMPKQIIFLEKKIEFFF